MTLADPDAGRVAGPAAGPGGGPGGAAGALRPGVLPPGGHIRVVSPASPALGLLRVRAERARRALESLGYRVTLGERAALATDDCNSAGSAADRAADLMDAFADPSVDAVLSSNGGNTTVDVLDHLDPLLVAAHPKPFAGFCDNVYLNHLLLHEADLISYAGICLMVHFGEAGGAFPETARDFAAALGTTGPLHCAPAGPLTGLFRDWSDPDEDEQPRPRTVAVEPTWIQGGRGTGRFVGGEIFLLPDLVRRFGLSLAGCVLFWDTATSNQRPIEPQFARLVEAVDLSRLAGMVIGAHVHVPPERWAATVRRMVAEQLPGADFPIMVNAGFTHLSPSWVVPFGEPAVLDERTGLRFPRVP